MLKKIFDMDNPLMQGLQTAAYLMILNFFTIILCIPVVTAGAAFTALHDVSISMIRQRETYPWKMYIDSFKKNLKQGILMGLIFIAAALLLLFNYNAAAAFIPPFRFVSLALGIILLAVSFYAFALLAVFDNTTAGTLKNALLLTAGYFPRTALMTVFAVAIIVLALRFPTLLAPVLLMFGFSLPVYVSALIYDPVLKELEEKQ